MIGLIVGLAAGAFTVAPSSVSGTVAACALALGWTLARALRVEAAEQSRKEEYNSLAALLICALQRGGVTAAVDQLETPFRSAMEAKRLARVEALCEIVEEIVADQRAHGEPPDSFRIYASDGPETVDELLAKARAGELGAVKCVESLTRATIRMSLARTHLQADLATPEEEHAPT